MPNPFAFVSYFSPSVPLFRIKSPVLPAAPTSSMATCNSLSSLFEKPIPENPTQMESASSWSQIFPKKALDSACFTEIFGELHFEEKPSNSDNQEPDSPEHCQESGCSGIKSSMDSVLSLSKNNGLLFPPIKGPDKLQLCTERLGFESTDCVDDLVDEDGGDQRNQKDVAKRNAMADGGSWNDRSDVRRKGGFPPPISSIGKSGKPRMYLKAYRQDGRFVLRELMIPTQEFLHASREDGRLKLQLVLPDGDGIPRGEEGGEHDDGEEEEEVEEEEKKEISEYDGD